MQSKNREPSLLFSHAPKQTRNLMKGLVVFQHNQKCVNSEGKLYHNKSGKHDKHINKRFPFVNLLRSVWLSFSILDIHQESKMGLSSLPHLQSFIILHVEL